MAKMPRVWDGSQWQELAVTLPDLSNYSTTTQMNTAIDNAKGLVLVKSQTIGSAVSSVTVSDAFSATYDAYKIIVSDGVGSTNNQFRLTLGASATAYYYAFSGMSYSTTGPSAGSYGRSNVAYYEAGNATTNFMCLDVDLINPFLAKYTIFKSHQVDTSSAYLFNGLHQVATSYTAFTLTASSGTWTGGTIRIYGYRNS